MSCQRFNISFAVLTCLFLQSARKLESAPPVIAVDESPPGKSDPIADGEKKVDDADREKPAAKDLAAIAGNLYEDADYKKTRAMQIADAAKEIAGKSASDADLNRPIQRIVGGVNALDSEVPGCVAILDEDGKLLCSGALVSPDVVVAPKSAFDGKTSAKLQVLAGLDTAEKTKNEIAQVSKLEFTSSGGVQVAVLVLASQVKSVEPMHVANADVIDKANETWLMGYATQDGESEVRHYVITPYRIDPNNIHFAAGEPASDPGNAIKSMGISVIVYGETNYLAGVFEKSIQSSQIYVRANRLHGTLESYVKGDLIGPWPPAKAATAIQDQKAKKEKAKAELVSALKALLKTLEPN